MNCKTPNPAVGCDVKDDNGNFLNFRGMETLKSYSFELHYHYEVSDIYIVKWVQKENPFSIVDTAATVSNLGTTLNGDIFTGYS